MDNKTELENKLMDSYEAYTHDVYDDILIDVIGVPEEVVNAIIGIFGKTQENYDKILNYYTGYRSLKTYFLEVVWVDNDSNENANNEKDDIE